MASFPGSVKTFTSKSAGQTIDPGHINDLQDEVNAVEAGYLNGTAPLNSSNSTLATLTVTGTATAAAQPRCNVYASAGQVISSGSTASVTLNVEETDVGGLFSTATYTATIPAGSSGLYQVTFMGFVNSTGQYDVYLVKNSSRELSVRAQVPVAGVTVIVPALMELNAAATIRVEAVTGATALTLGSATATFANRLTLTKLW